MVHCRALPCLRRNSKVIARSFEFCRIVEPHSVMLISLCKPRYCLPAGEVVWVRSIVKKYHNMVRPWEAGARVMGSQTSQREQDRATHGGRAESDP
jgi:hypothetical protein